ncbi:acyltransferase [Streptomyces sp. NBC_00247]|uniref:acyltransferase family protein n=1 Tax=Streptomyces sp. NBC_00247 TaxID=2975689 RepID=UPI002E2C9DF7|nr:acyltransferase family protein [Streptomyces sp. NBC_00247]
MTSATSVDIRSRPVDGTAGPAPGGAPAHRTDIQGLRAVAVGLVVLSHAGVAGVAGGYVGVDVFFVISGFLITTLLLREHAATGRVSLRAFYARRALRLLPAASLVTVLTLAGAWTFLSKARLAEYAGDALSSALYLVNFRLARSGTDYLAQDSPPSPFQHFWSLAVEEQFYLGWPLLLLLALRLARGRYARVALPLGAVCLGSFALSVLLTRSSASWAYFGTPARAWELGAGAMTALAAGRPGPVPAPGRSRPWFAAALSWSGLACVLVAALRYDDATPFPGHHAALPVLGTVLVLGAGAAPARYGAGLLLGRRPLVWAGGLSYGWYLWHWPLLVIGPMALGGDGGVPTALALCAVALVLAWLTLHLVENPVRFHRAFGGHPRRALMLGAGLAAGITALALTAAAVPPVIETGPPAPALARELAGAPDPAARLTRLIAAAPAELPANLAPGPAGVKAARSAVYRDGCQASYDSTEVRPCVYGDPAGSRTVVLFGDSHAAQWFPAFQRLATDHHWRLVSLTKASCKAAEVTIISAHRPYTACDTWRKKALARIESLHPDLVVVTSSDAGDPYRPTADPLGQWTGGFETVYRRLAAHGTRVAALLDTPWPKGDPVDCAADNSTRLRACGTTLSAAIHDPVRSRAVRSAASATGATLIDPRAWVCDTRAGRCPVVVGNVSVYRDTSHLSDGYTTALAPVLEPVIEGLLESRP